MIRQHVRRNFPARPSVRRRPFPTPPPQVNPTYLFEFREFRVRRGFIPRRAKRGSFEVPPPQVNPFYLFEFREFRQRRQFRKRPAEFAPFLIPNTAPTDAYSNLIEAAQPQGYWPLGVNVASAFRTFNYTGGPQYYVVPLGVTGLIVNVQGAQGGPGSGTTTGGLGGRVQCTVGSLIPGETLQINVGQAGALNGTATFGGGGASNVASGLGGSGGGASDIRRAPYGLADRLVVGGGGGGGGGNNSTLGQGGIGGAGNGGTGAGGDPTNNGAPGAGATTSAGGTFGGGPGGNGTAGVLGVGGNGGNSNVRAGGGGGGGNYGGGGGGGGAPGGGGGGGGGGSGLGTGVAQTLTDGFRAGDGTVVLLEPVALVEVDQSGQQHHQVWNAAPTASAFVANAGVSLNGTQETVSVDTPRLWEQVQFWSLEWWHQSSSTGAGLFAIADRRVGNDEWAVYLDRATPQVQLTIRQVGGGAPISVTSTGINPFDGAIHHYVVEVFRSGADTAYQFYRDGVACGNGTLFTGTVPDVTSEPFRIAGENATRRFIGSLAHVAFYNYALPLSVVQAHYAAGAPAVVQQWLRDFTARRRPVAATIRRSRPVAFPIPAQAAPPPPSWPPPVVTARRHRVGRVRRGRPSETIPAQVVVPPPVIVHRQTLRRRVWNFIARRGERFGLPYPPTVAPAPTPAPTPNFAVGPDGSAFVAGVNDGTTSVVGDDGRSLAVGDDGTTIA